MFPASTRKAKNNECSVHSNQSKALVNTTVHWLSTEPSKGLLEEDLATLARNPRNVN
jgi:hypothetical protein